MIINLTKYVYTSVVNDRLSQIKYNKHNIINGLYNDHNYYVHFFLHFYKLLKYSIVQLILK